MEIEDNEYEEATIADVRESGDDGWQITRSDGWSFWVHSDSPVKPAAGMKARFYGKGIGSTVRGLELDGVRVFYRTEAEDREKHEIDTYGADAADWLARWDSGRTCWTIEMGGLGPGYEQCIHVTLAEILRHMLEQKYDHTVWSDKDLWKRDRELIEKWSFENATIKALGLSGAQWGAALNLATHFYMHGPRSVMKDDRVKDRRIQVSKGFPAAA